MSSEQDRELLELAMEALELADGVMSYCGGDAWERECTASDRARFDAIYAQLFPKPVEPPKPTSRKEVLRVMHGSAECPHCKKQVSGARGALKQHVNQFHAITRAAAALAKGEGV